MKHHPTQGLSLVVVDVLPASVDHWCCGRIMFRYAGKAADASAEGISACGCWCAGGNIPSLIRQGRAIITTIQLGSLGGPSPSPIGRCLALLQHAKLFNPGVRSGRHRHSPPCPALADDEWNPCTQHLVKCNTPSEHRLLPRWTYLLSIITPGGDIATTQPLVFSTGALTVHTRRALFKQSFHANKAETDARWAEY